MSRRRCSQPCEGARGGMQGGPGQSQGQGTGSRSWGAGFAAFMSTYGAVPVTASNFFRLMQAGEAVLLFPGGVREVRPPAGTPPPVPIHKATEMFSISARHSFCSSAYEDVGVGAWVCWLSDMFS